MTFITGDFMHLHWHCTQFIEFGRFLPLLFSPSNITYIYAMIADLVRWKWFIILYLFPKSWHRYAHTMQMTNDYILYNHNGKFDVRLQSEYQIIDMTTKQHCNANVNTRIPFWIGKKENQYVAKNNKLCNSVYWLFSVDYFFVTWHTRVHTNTHT